MTARAMTAPPAPVSRWAGPLLLGAFSFGALFLGVYGYDDTTPVVLLITTLGLALFVPQIFLGMNRRWQVFDPLTSFLLMCTFGYFFRSMHLLWHEKAALYHIPLWREDALALLAQGLAIVVMGVVAFLGGYASRVGNAIAATLPVLSPVWSLPRLRFIWIAYTVIGALVYTVFAQQAGGLLYLATNMQLRTESSQGLHLFYFGIRFLSIALLFRLVLLLKSNPSRVVKATFVLQCVLVLASLGVLGSRSWAVEVLFMLLVTRHFLYRPIKLRTLGMIAALGLLLFAIFYQYRNFTHEGIEEGEIDELKRSQITLFYDGIIGHRNFDMLDNLLSVVHYTPERFPHLLGSSYAHLFVNIVPRSMWEGKPRGLGSVLSEKVYGWGKGGAPPGALGELYFNFGVLGIVPGMVVFGIFARTFSCYARSNTGNPLAILLLAVVIVYVAMLTRGTFFKVGSTLFMRLVPLLLGAGFVAGWRIMRRRPA